tara:strand:- start:1602 stop:2093 length:492 start_codon:yes stop_codon:yes gene_type:complete
MATTNHSSSLTDWRNSFSLVRNNLYCPGGQTFRGAHASVQMPFKSNSCITEAKNDAGKSSGTAKPGPTTDTSSRIARLKKLQVRTRGNTGTQSNGGTDRGAHGSVQNASDGTDAKSRRAQLFGHYGKMIPGQTSGRNGSSSDVIYFKNVFDRISLNTTSTGNN